MKKFMKALLVILTLAGLGFVAYKLYEKKNA